MNKLTMRPVLYSWMVCGLGALFYCYEYLLRASPSVMTEQIMRFYHLTGAQMGNLSQSFYYYSYVALQVFVGLLMDRYGPRRLLTFACLLCVVGAYFFACSHNIMVAMFGRFLVGFGSAFAFVGAAKLATIWLPPERFALVSGIIFCLGMLGAVFGSIILRILVDASGWQVAMFGAAAVGLIITLIIWSVVRDVNPYHENHYSHHTPSLKEVFLGLLLALKNTQVWLAGIAGCLLYLFLTAYAELWGPAYLEQARGLLRIDAVGANSLVFLGCAAGAPLWGWFSDLIGRRCLPIIATSIGALIVVCVLLYANHLSLSAVYLLSFCFGFFSSAQILVFAIAREVTPIKIAGTTIGLLNMLVMVGGIIFPPIVGKLLDVFWIGTMVDGARVYSAHAFTIALSVLPIGIVLGIVAMMFVRETYCRIFLENHHPR
jgi:MFS family permease